MSNFPALINNVIKRTHTEFYTIIYSKNKTCVDGVGG